MTRAAQDLIEYAFLAAFVGIAGYGRAELHRTDGCGTYNTWIDPTTGAPASGNRRIRGPAPGHRRLRLMDYLDVRAAPWSLWHRLAGGGHSTCARGRIPNWLTFGAALAALAYGAFDWRIAGVGISAAGWLAGAALFFPFFALGGMGAGDVKLLAALGAWLGPAESVWLAMFAASAGGVARPGRRARPRLLADRVLESLADADALADAGSSRCPA